MSITCQLNASYFARSGSSGIMSSVMPSIWMLLRSISRVRLSSLSFPASITASHVLPASCSASDAKQYTCHFFLSMRPTIAMPTACDVPVPNGPDVVSMPGNAPRCGCPCRRVPNFRNVFSSSFGKYPASASVAYNTGQMWPLERMMRSLSSQSGFFGLCLAI